MKDELFDLTGKIALVTGGSRGLGLQMARAFAERGADVIIASRKLDACENVAEEIRKMGRKALAIAANLSFWDQADYLADRAYGEWGRVDILVNNAGKSPRVPSHEISKELFDKIVGLNFSGPFRLAALIAKRMYDGGGGAIINVSSMAASHPQAQVVPYSAAKAAMNAMTVAFAREYGPKVRVNAISPGPFLTDISKAWPPEQREKSNNALGRPGLPNEIVTAALFLASPASSFTTGAVVNVDGGV